MLWSVIQVVKVLSHLSGGEESHFPYPQTGGENSFHNDSNLKEFTVNHGKIFFIPYCMRGV